MTSKPRTRSVRAGAESDPQHGSVIPPLYPSTTYAFAGLGQPRAYDYARGGNPTTDLLARTLAELEQGAGAVVTASGMAAVTLVCQLFEPEDLVLVPHDCYGGSYRLFEALSRHQRLRVRFVDFTDAGDWKPALADGPALVWLESPSNPLLRITDIAEVSEAAHDRGALVAVDNTFLSPVWQQPLSLGADLVVHSTTKYLNGHSDVIGGGLVARDQARVDELAWWANCLGLTAGAWESYLVQRGLRSLHARMADHAASAQAVAEHLAEQPTVRAVHYPGLPAHPGYELARRQQACGGAIVSFELAGEAAVRAFLEGLTCFSLAESLGSVESLVAHPASMTHAAVNAEAQQHAGITPGLLRLSIGLEAVEDLIADLDAGLARAARAVRG